MVSLIEGLAATTNTTTGISDASVQNESDHVADVRHRVQPEEFIILAVIVALWLMAVFVFLKKWDSIRILQPMEPRYKHSPKNLESVRVVKRAQDSVIYKNYSRKMSVTMVARENRRLQRMHTAPCISPLPVIHAEDVTTEI